MTVAGKDTSSDPHQVAQLPGGAHYFCRGTAGACSCMQDDGTNAKKTHVHFVFAQRSAPKITHCSVSCLMRRVAAAGTMPHMYVPHFDSLCAKPYKQNIRRYISAL
jgi:hypothetical protein